jgi:hypothetical protein
MDTDIVGGFVVREVLKCRVYNKTSFLYTSFYNVAMSRKVAQTFAISFLSQG